MRRPAKIGLVLLGLVLLAGVGLYLSIDLDEVLSRETQRLLPRIEQQLGRKVSVARVRTRLGGSIGGSLEGITLGPAAGAPADAPAPLQVAELRLRMAFWPALLSLGKDLRIEEVVLRGVHLRVARDAAGRLSYQDVIERLAAPGAPTEPATTPAEAAAAEAELRAYLRGLAVARVALEDARIDLRDEASGGAAVEGSVEGLQVELLGLRAGHPLDLKVRARVFAAQENLRLDARSLALGEDLLETTGMGLQSLTLHSEALDLGRIAPYLGPGLPVQIDAARLSSDLTLENLSLDPSREARVAGGLRLSGLRLQGGEAFDLSLETRLVARRGGDEVQIDALDLDVGGLTLRAKGLASGLLGGLPHFKGLEVDAPAVELGLLLARLPPLAAALPKGSKLSGPLSLALRADGDPQHQEIGLQLSATATRILLPGSLDKAAGVPLELGYQGAHGGGKLSIADLKLRFGPIALAGKGSVDLAQSQADLSIASQPFSLEALLKLLPSLTGAAPAGLSYGGQGRFSLQAKGGAQGLALTLDAGVAQAAVEAPGLGLQGAVDLRLEASGRPDALNAALRVELGGAGLRIPDTLDKPSGMPAHLALQIRRTGAVIDLSQAELVLGPLAGQASGRVALGGASDLKLSLARTDLGALAKIVPPLAPFAARGGHLALSARAQGDLLQPPSLKAQLESLDLGLGRSSLKLQGQMERLEPLTASFSLDSPYLDLDELLAALAGQSPAEPAQSEPAAPQLPKDWKVTGRLRVAKGRLNAAEFQQLEGDLAIAQGVATLNRFQLRAFEGTLDAGGTQVDLSGSEPAFRAKARIVGMDATALLTSQTSLGDTLAGKLGAGLEVSGRGLAFDRFAKTLSGSLDGQLKKGELRRANLGGETLGGLLRALPAGLGGPRADALRSQRGTPVDDLAARFRIQDGRMTLVEDLQLRSGADAVTLGGSVGLDKSLDLRGVYAVAPSTLALITGGRLKPQGPVPISLRVGGTVLRPRIESVGVEAAAAGLAKSVVGDRAAALVQDAREQAEARARAAAAEAEAEARRRAGEAAERGRQEAERARQRAEAEARRARQEAERRAREEAERARKKAEAEAKKRLRGLF